MRRSESLLCMSREANSYENETVALTMRAGLARQFGSGLYGFTPTGQRVRRNLIELVEHEMNKIGGQQISLPSLNHSDIWKQSGRWGSFEGEMFTFQNRDDKELCLAPSHEEGVAQLVDGVVRSYEDLPLLLYQIESKYRDDHARNGLVRTKEFTMKDAYSLHTDRESLDEYYDRVRGAYERICERLDLDYVVTSAANSVMGGSTSEEFVALADIGTLDLRWCTGRDCHFGVTDESPRAALSAGDSCPECESQLAAGEGIEIGHVFKLGTRYGDSMDVTVDLADGSQTALVMGSYGIGIERLLHVLVEQHSDDRGCRWNGTDVSSRLHAGGGEAVDRRDDDIGIVAPFEVAIIPLEYDGELRETADRLHEVCGRDDTLLFDDRDQEIGERFAESDLLGIPWKLILGNHYQETGSVELESRDGTTEYVDPSAVADHLGLG